MVILTTTYNCEFFIEKCIQSLLDQSFKDFVCYITDDMSTDRTVEKARSIINNDPRFIIMENKAKMFQPGNYDQVIRNNDKITDNEVCVELDGDDWFPDREVLQRIANVYQNNFIWLANGSFQYQDGRSGFAQKPSIWKSIRKQNFTLTHIRTWRAFLWRKILLEDLMDANGQYYDVAGDLAFMFPMYEMAGILHYRFLKETNYVYNESNPLNDHKVHMEKVNRLVKEIRSKKPYKMLWLR